jgi:hypothetical protein
MGKGVKYAMYKYLSYAIFIVLLFVQDIKGENIFTKALRATPHQRSDVFGTYLTCKRDDRVFELHGYEPLNRYSKETTKKTFDKLVQERVSADNIFRLSFFENIENDPEEPVYIDAKDTKKYIYDDIAVFNVDAPSKFRFIFPNESNEIHIELTDPNMKPIRHNAYPKNTRIEEGPYCRYVYILNAVRIWENNAVDQKMNCDITFEIDYVEHELVTD